MPDVPPTTIGTFVGVQVHKFTDFLVAGTPQNSSPLESVTFRFVAGLLLPAATHVRNLPLRL